MNFLKNFIAKEREKIKNNDISLAVPKVSLLILICIAFLFTFKVIDTHNEVFDKTFIITTIVLGIIIFGFDTYLKSDKGKNKQTETKDDSDD